MAVAMLTGRLFTNLAKKRAYLDPGNRYVSVRISGSDSSVRAGASTGPRCLAHPAHKHSAAIPDRAHHGRGKSPDRVSRRSLGRETCLAVIRTCGGIGGFFDTRRGDFM
jgi:hypothetical protein